MANLRLNSSSGGYVEIAPPATASQFTLTAPANNATLFTTAGGAISGNVSFANAVTFSSNNITIGGSAISPAVGMRNRIINGDMRIDQRNVGTSVTTGVGVNYAVDRTATWTAVASKFTTQRNQGSVTPPTGFTNYLGATCVSAYTPGSTEYFLFQQAIEGFNISDLAWGTANAKTITISFWIRSNQTGTYAFALRNGALNRQYVTSYTINSSNTWEYKTITIPGDTTGTWPTDNSAALLVNFDLGSHSTYEATTLNAWGNQGSNNQAYTFSGATKIISGLNNYLYLTGLQVEEGSNATPFERRPYGTELSLCQRYFEKSYRQTTKPGTAGDTSFVVWDGGGFSGNAVRTSYYFKVDKRAAPTVVCYSPTSGASGKADISGVVTSYIMNTMFETGFNAYGTGVSTGGYYISYHWTAEAEL